MRDERGGRGEMTETADGMKRLGKRFRGYFGHSKGRGPSRDEGYSSFHVKAALICKLRQNYKYTYIYIYSSKLQVLCL